MARWQLFSAVVLRRFPETIPRRDIIQLKVQKIFNDYEASKSRFSQHELDHLENIRLQESGDQVDVTLGETAQDREDRWIAEKSNFKFPEHDDKFTKTHYLFMQSKFGSDIKDQWLLPQTTFDRNLGDRNLLDTARRALSDSLNISNGYRIVCKVPSAVSSFEYPKKIQDMTGYHGAKVFFLKAHLDQPSVSVLESLDSSKNEKLKWMTQDEARLVVSKRYMLPLSAALLHETPVDVDKVLRRASVYASTVRKKISSVCQ